MTEKNKETILTVTGFILLVSILWCSNIYYYRFDITKNKIYTLTDASKNIYKEIPQPVIITYYVTKNIESVLPDIENVKDILNEFRISSHGKIIVNIIDPAEEKNIGILEDIGIYSQSFKIIKENEEKTMKIFSAVKVQFLNRIKILPAVYNSNDLEYQIVSKIREIIQNRRRIVGILIGENSRQMDTDFTILRDQLSKDFDIKVIKPGESVISEINVLIVIGSRDIGIFDIKRIKDFIKSGGNVLFAVDGVNINLEKNLEASPLHNDLVINFLKSYGLALENSLVVDPFSRDFRIPKSIYGSIAWETIGPYPLWVSVKSTISNQSPITAHFTGLDLLWVSPVKIDSKIKNRTEVLIKSSTLAWLMSDNFKTSPYTVSEYGQRNNQLQNQYNLAVTLSLEDSRIILVGDSDFLSDLIQYSDSYYNMRFTLNCIDWLSQNEDFMSIRTRHDRNVFLDKFPAEMRSTVYLISQILNIFIIPMIILIIGIFSYKRETRKK